MKRRSCAAVEENKRCPASWPMYSLVGTVAIACYLNGLNGDFVHDDIPAITFNKDVLAVNPLSHVFKNDFWGTPMADVASHKSYRPLTTLTFRANYLCFGLQSTWFHVTNVALHAVACVLFTKVCLYVADLKPPFATLGGLLFATHPIHTEAVTGIVGRADVLACIFFLTSFLAYHGQADGECHIWISILLGGLSMLAKETGVTVFLLNLLFDLFKTWPSVKKTVIEVKWNKETQNFANRAAKCLTSLGLLLTIRLILLQGSLPRFSPQDNPTAFHPSIYVRVLTFCYLATFNWWLLLCPATLSHDWQMGSIPLVISVNDSRNLVTVAFFGLALLLTTKSLIDFEYQRHVPLVLGSLLLILPFLPATNLIVTVGFVVAERVLYIPSTGCILLSVYGTQLMWNAYVNNRQTILCFVFLILTTNCVRIAIRNKDWRSRESLLRAGLKTLPHNAKMHYNYGNFLRDSGRPELAKSYYYSALKLWPTYASAHNNLGTLIPDQTEAERHFLLAIRYSADHLNAHYNLGQLYRKSNRSLESERILKRCIQLDYSFTPTYVELARLYGPNDLRVKSILLRVIQLNPSDAHYITIYSHWLLDKGKIMIALKYYWQAMRVSPTHVGAVIGACKILRKFGDYSRLFQIILRWHIILRSSRGEVRSNSHIYLHEWYLKNELSNRARAYDANLQVFAEETVDVSSNMWNRISYNRTKSELVSKERRTNRKSQKHKSTAPLIVNHFLDTL